MADVGQGEIENPHGIKGYIPPKFDDNTDIIVDDGLPT